MTNRTNTAETRLAADFIQKAMERPADEQDLRAADLRLAMQWIVEELARTELQQNGLSRWEWFTENTMDQCRGSIEEGLSKTFAALSLSLKKDR